MCVWIAVSVISWEIKYTVPIKNSTVSSGLGTYKEEGFNPLIDVRVLCDGWYANYFRKKSKDIPWP